MKEFMLIILVFIISSASLAETENKEEEMTEERATYYQLLNTKYTLLPHKGNYFLPFVYNALPHESIYEEYKSVEAHNQNTLYKNQEAEFQFSFLFPLYRKIAKSQVDLDFAYTHHSWWQIYNSEWSRPFRETNYMPEIFFRTHSPEEKRFWNLDLLAIDAGYMHHSNGQIQLLSRSWNRLFARAYLRHPEFMMILTGWYRLPEQASNDDNPDIYNFYGLGELELIKGFGKHTIDIKTPLLSHHASLDLKYSYPWEERLRWYFSFQVGYAQSLIEYDHPTQRYGVGLIMESFWDKRE